MTFLQPWLLAGLPLVALPILIHLINQRRYQTIRWGAMMFLLAAHRMARGFSRLRQWLIMLFRMLAIATLVLAIARPLASGWLGLAAAGKPDTTLILLDRSPSMQQRAPGSTESKLATGRKQLAEALETLGSNRWVLIDSVTCRPSELERPKDLQSHPAAGPSSAPADLPLMLQAANDYLRNNRSGRAEVWICSDLRSGDWTPQSGRWGALRTAFLEFPQGVRFQLLAYPQPAPENLAVRVTEARRASGGDGAELFVSLRVSREGASDEKIRVPVHFEIDGARSVMNVDLTGPFVEFKDHRIPLERGRERGWGRVSIPADANPADDDFHFVFDNPPPRRTILVAEEPSVERPLQLVASIAPEQGLDCAAETLTIDKLSSVPWDEVGLVLWQAPLPSGAAAEMLTSFVDRGGQMICFPPRNPDDESWFGANWKAWAPDHDPLAIETWRGDEDLLSRTLSGAALPVGQLEVRRYCGLEGEFVSLATLVGGAPLLVRAPSTRGGVYFCATTPAGRDSSLATGGVVLYALVQRSLSAGAAVLGKALQLDAGSGGGEATENWTRLSQAGEGISTEFRAQRGVYAAGDRLLAVNRPASEDQTAILSGAQVEELFSGLELTRIDDQAGAVDSLVQEIWRGFLLAMLFALLLEAALSMPNRARAPGAAQ